MADDSCTRQVVNILLISAAILIRLVEKVAIELDVGKDARPVATGCQGFETLVPISAISSGSAHSIVVTCNFVRIRGMGGRAETDDASALISLSIYHILLVIQRCGLVFIFK